MENNSLIISKEMVELINNLNSSLMKSYEILKDKPLNKEASDMYTNQFYFILTLINKTTSELIDSIDDQIENISE